MGLGSLCRVSSIPSAWTSPGADGTRSASRRNAAFLLLRSIRWTIAPGVSASAQANTMPGKPPPLPRSTQILAFGASFRSWSESATCRVQSCGSVEGATRLVLACHSLRSARYRSSRASVSRETGISANAVALSDLSEAGCPKRSSFHVKQSGGHFGLAPRLAAKIGGQDAECSRRHAIDPARLPHGPGLRARELAADLVGKTRHHSVVDLAEHEAFVATEGIDIGALALEIDVILGIDLEMDRDGGVNGRQLRPD